MLDWDSGSVQGWLCYYFCSCVCVGSDSFVGTMLDPIMHINTIIVGVGLQGVNLVYVMSIQVMETTVCVCMCVCVLHKTCSEAPQQSADKPSY